MMSKEEYKEEYTKILAMETANLISRIIKSDNPLYIFPTYDLPPKLLVHGKITLKNEKEESVPIYCFGARDENDDVDNDKDINVARIFFGFVINSPERLENIAQRMLEEAQKLRDLAKETTPKVADEPV